MCCGRLPAAAEFDTQAWFDELYMHFAQPGVWLLYADARRCLDRLQGRHRLAVISNFDGRLRRVLDDLGVSARFKGLFISSELGCEKPDRAIFRQALEFMNAEPARCIHAGDDPERDWAGAAGQSAFSSDASGSDTGRPCSRRSDQHPTCFDLSKKWRRSRLTERGTHLLEVLARPGVLWPVIPAFSTEGVEHRKALKKTRWDV